MKSSESKNYKKMVKTLADPRIQVWRTVMEVFQSVFDQLETQLNEQGVHMSRFQILFFLYFEGPMSASELARCLLVTRGNISTFIRRLDDDGQIEICPSSPSDARPRYCLTKEAIELFEELFVKHTKLVKKLVPGLGESLKEKLEKL
ncbi:MAG: MarR family transcriptional regulator [Bacteriovoracaceae bacterium]|nr:MarR family transcriptional regulator [Bacteriovoracaceae bacterium]